MSTQFLLNVLIVIIRAVIVHFNHEASNVVVGEDSLHVKLAPMKEVNTD